ncbi:MAG: hypothetical protein ICV62_17645, partial [Cyanobacteria bacterium Co-bin13]|nr:hypothetical protein [Cyanobacteria bacterium Co-bin13]
MTALLQLVPALPELTHWLTDIGSQFSHQISQSAHALVNWYAQAGHATASALSQFSDTFTSAVLWQSVLYWALILVMLVGVAGAFIPALPGITLI